MLSVSFSPERDALLENRSNTLNVLVRISADDLVSPKKEREALNLSVVIDRSGSMSGKPLREAVRCAGMILDRLDQNDRLSIVTYDNNVSVQVPSQFVGDRHVFRNALKNIREGGTTNLHGGWLSGAEQVALHENKKAISRVLLLSDGCANDGVTDTDEIVRHCATLADSGVQTSTYGLGEGFNELLMAGMAKAGLGNGYYGQTAEDLMDPFTEEFDLLSSLCAKKIRLTLQTSSGVEVEVLNGYSKDREGRFILPDLAFGGEAWAMLNLTVPAPIAKNGIGSIHLLTARVDFEDMQNQPQSDLAYLKIEPLPVNAFEAIAIDPNVRSRVAEVRAANLQERARIAARQQDWGQVEELLQELRKEVAHSPWLAVTISELERYARERETDSFSKEALYSAQKMRTRLAEKNEIVSWSFSAETDKSSFLRRKSEQGKRFGSDDSQ
jgi:Ca-activated chloride channel family protein